jgi:hypothetical protein
LVLGGSRKLKCKKNIGIRSYLLDSVQGGVVRCGGGWKIAIAAAANTSSRFYQLAWVHLLPLACFESPIIVIPHRGNSMTSFASLQNRQRVLEWLAVSFSSPSYNPIRIPKSNPRVASKDTVKNTVKEHLDEAVIDKTKDTAKDKYEEKAKDAAKDKYEEKAKDAAKYAAEFTAESTITILKRYTKSQVANFTVSP